MGLPIHTWNEALMAEADLDSVEDMFSKFALSLYVRINPTNTNNVTLAKRKFLEKQPIWSKVLNTIPSTIWAGDIQEKLANKKGFPSNDVTATKDTINNQNEVEPIEDQFDHILYTDASVDLSSNPPGKAAIGYIWYEKQLDNTWIAVLKESISIGTGHSSYSAEAISIQEALKQCPLPSTYKEKIGVFTDSLSNIATIHKGVALTSEQESLLSTIQQFPRSISFHHVRSHQNIQRNIEVDQLCDVKKHMPERKFVDMTGTKTPSKIKEWMNAHMKSERAKRVLLNKKANERGSLTQQWMLKFMKTSNMTRPNHNEALRERKAFYFLKHAPTDGLNATGTLPSSNKKKMPNANNVEQWTPRSMSLTNVQNMTRQENS